jgi:hypothetical protein
MQELTDSIKRPNLRIMSIEERELIDNSNLFSPHRKLLYLKKFCWLIEKHNH